VIDKWTGNVMPEPGPNMMWNQKYGRMMNGMSGHMKKNRPFTPAVTPDQAAAAANQFLQQRFGQSHHLALDGPPDTYYGYYCFDVNDVTDPANPRKFGMMSVDTTAGQVWFHTWHGNLIRGQELN